MANVKLRNVEKRFGELVATDNISLDIEDGELAVLVGPSGCGKTTTLRMIAGLETPTSGTITFDERDVTNVPPQSRNISMVFQDLALYPHMTAFENIAFPLKANGNLSNDEMQRRIEEIAETANCDEFLDKSVTALSGGQRQRVALARALIREPDVFLLDEPLSDLDELMKRQIRAAIERLQSELEITMVHVTHDQEEAMTMGDRIVVLNDGEIAQVGSPSQVFDEPVNLFVASFIGSPQINQFAGTVAERNGGFTLTAGDQEFDLTGELAERLSGRSSEEITLCVRPQHLSWSEEEPDDETEISIPITVAVIEQTGTEDIIRALTSDEKEITAVVPSGTLSEEMTGYLVVDQSKVHVFDGHDPQAERLT